ncbi:MULTISPECIES: hypothetical protein [Afipia]|jgi:hypothetical protein|uniref:Uncharacterized protein n=2 Tax=Bacteria TaxID=2 RepID=K8P056_9BRAD|nr:MULTISPECIES: hypothetical protein [Afipia]MBQ8106428.1 hypothetical protein [Afipia sp.]MDI1263931.1 hypothetical protein [bacterium]RTL78688.1 MAG: hypothetical protein EKK35_11535 [Bradyrhizobiaceae bacterium]EKS35982.1 hypothetical protein HMPREF9696_02194 [Afipia clevelandensis ATCC 49720]MBS4002681.1 hypothetical protein [Afipia sp.]
MNIAVKAALGCALGFIVVGALVGGGKSAPPPAPSVPLPSDQARFIEAVTKARSQFIAAANELAAGGLRNSRQQAVCNALQGNYVSGWIAKVADQSTNGDGKGVVTLELAPNLQVSTWNNAVSDFSDKTLIDPESQLFKSLAAMKRGDTVRFSGDFFPSKVDCVREMSVTLAGSMRSPVFTMRFSSIRKL